MLVAAAGLAGVAATPTSAWPLAALAAIVLGLGYGPITPASSHVLARTAPAARRNLVFSIKQTGVPAGAALAGAVAAGAGPGLGMARGARRGRARRARRGGRRAAPAGRPRCRPRSGRAHHGRAGLRVGAPAVCATPAWRRSPGSRSRTRRRRSRSPPSSWSTRPRCSAGRSWPPASRSPSPRWPASRAVSSSDGSPTAAATADVLPAIGVLAGACALVLAFAPASWPGLAILAVAALFGATAIGWNGVYLAELARRSPPGMAGGVTGASGVVTFGGVMIGPTAVRAAVRPARGDADRLRDARGARSRGPAIAYGVWEHRKRTTPPSGEHESKQYTVTRSFGRRRFRVTPACCQRAGRRSARVLPRRRGFEYLESISMMW